MYYSILHSFVAAVKIKLNKTHFLVTSIVDIDIYYDYVYKRIVPYFFVTNVCLGWFMDIDCLYIVIFCSTIYTSFGIYIAITIHKMFSFMKITNRTIVPKGYSLQLNQNVKIFLILFSGKDYLS